MWGLAKDEADDNRQVPSLNRTIYVPTLRTHAARTQSLNVLNLVVWFDYPSLPVANTGTLNLSYR
jgi:hypothetical protein